MDEGRELWKEYCGFFDKPFSEQIAHNEMQKQKFFEEWKNTKAAKHLCPDGIEAFEDIPLTTYDDYPILHEFGEEVERLSESVPRNKEESLWDYYDRISRQVAPMLDGWLADDYSFCSKTSGTSGDSKWLVYGKQFMEIGSRNIISIMIFSCCDIIGTTKLRRGDKIFGVAGSFPYIGGMFFKALLDHGFKLVPPLHITENESDMRKKIMTALKMIQKGEKVDIAGGIASSFHTTSRYFTNRKSLYKDYYQSMKFGIPKMVLFFMWLFQSLFGKEYKKAMDIMPVKGMATGGFDTEIYAEYLKEQFGLEPLNIYGSTESGYSMAGSPHRKKDLMPFMNSGYFEFITDNGEMRKINELEKDHIYEMIFTPFRSAIMRYKTGDLFKVSDFREDGLPIFNFESKKADTLDVRNYFRLSEALATKTLVKTGFPPTDKWAFSKEVEPEDHLCLLMERVWDYTEKEASEKLYEVLTNTDPYFQNYLKDFSIKDPMDVIRVEYLKNGAFMRYMMYRAKEGVEMGQIKPPKLITPQRKDVADLLRKI